MRLSPIRLRNSDVSPTGAWQDLRDALRLRHAYQFWFMLAALLITGGVWYAFYQDSQFERPYKREIVYVESWPADRTIEQIIAKQKIDEPIRLKREAELKARAEKRRQEFKKVDDALKEWGI